MKTSKQLFAALMCITTSAGIITASAQTAPPENTTGLSIQGEVVGISGTRLDLRMPDGSIVSVTTRDAIPVSYLDKTVSGTVVEAGDTLLIVNPVFGK